MNRTLHKHFRMCARYNSWANQQLYDACAKLSEGTYKQPRPALFKSIHGVLNHILVVDRIWLARLNGYDTGISTLEEELHDDFRSLRDARVAEDVILSDYVHGLSDEDLERPIAYRNLADEPHANSQYEILAHLFNHQSHHRGQVNDHISQSEVSPPDLSLIDFLRQTA